MSEKSLALYKAKEARSILKVCKKTFERICQRKELPVIRIHGRIYVRSSALELFIAEHEIKAVR